MLGHSSRMPSSALAQIFLIIAAFSSLSCAVVDFGDLDAITDLQGAANEVSKQVQAAIRNGDGGRIRELGELGKRIARKINMKYNDAMAAVGPIRLHNWGGTFQYSTQNIQYPRTTAEVQQIVRNAIKMRVLGSRHSFSPIADSPQTMLSTLGMNTILGLNPAVPSVTVQAGITYTDLCPFLHAIGLAFPNLAALGEISIGGSIATGVHGSGIGHQALASQMLSLEMVLADGTVASYKKGDPEWNGLAVGLGAFGVVTQVELQLEPTYNVVTNVFLNMPMANLLNNFDSIMALGYTVQLFSAMSDPNIMDHVWVLVRPDQDVNNVGNMSTLFGATRAPGQVTPIAALPSTYLVDQGVQQPWFEGLTDYKFGLSGADGNEIQTEWIVPHEHAVAAIRAVNDLSAELAPLIYVYFIRTIKSDQFWMSQSSGGQAHVAIHFTWQPNMAAVLEKLPKVNDALLPFNARPHWGKLFTLGPQQFLPTYPNWKKFTKLAKQLDPLGKFRNEFLEKNIFVDTK